MTKLTPEKREKLMEFLKEYFPDSLSDIKITEKDGKVYICSSLSIAESDFGIEHMQKAEKLLDAEFEGLISNNGLYGSVYKLN